MSVYAIGDIHGQLKPLKSIFEDGKFNDHDIFVFLGDYIDRGNDIKDVIDYLIKLSTQYKCYFVKGNHELMICQAKWNRNNLIQWLYNGGDKTLDSYSINDDPNWYKKIPKSHWDFIENTLPFYEKDNLIFVHAGLEPNVELKAQSKDYLYWKIVKNPVKYKEGRIVVCGHYAQFNGQITNYGHTIFIDTYLCGGQWLTCLNVESGEYIQANKDGEIRYGRIDIATSKRM